MTAQREPQFPLPADFDPAAAARPDSGLFGLDVDPRTAGVHVIPVPWDATASYRKGTHRAHAAVLAASRQIDLFDLEYGRPYEAGIALLDAHPELGPANAEASERADRVLAVGGEIGDDAELAADRARVDELGARVNAIVRARTAATLEAGKLPVVLGGDHSVPFGAYQAADEHVGASGGWGLLHVDAHADLRPAYEGFTWSHASIFHNALAHTAVERLVQFGIRDFSEAEYDAIRGSEGRVHTVFDQDWARVRSTGGDLAALVRTALERLPRQVWISIDIDGLDPELCPSTGTPVPGGLGWHDVLLVLHELAASGRRVIGCDLCEVNPGIAPRPSAGSSRPGGPELEPRADATQDAGDTWDAIVGARLLYKLIGCALKTRSGTER